jgi:2-amino-4-hydroxy-6-hydroxymethyldihydropteridine diphosphokinase
VRRAIQEISQLPTTRLLQTSRLFRTKPVDAQGSDYVNAVVSIDTTLTAHELLGALQNLEQLAGRERPYHNAPRTLDLDVLLFGDTHITTADLTLPHPRMFQRAFVLVPLAEIAPQLVSPVQLAAVADQQICPI